MKLTMVMCLHVAMLVYDSQVEPGSKTAVPQGHAAGLAAAKVWGDMELAMVMWMVHWTTIQGLRPKRPIIVFAKSCVLPAEAAVQLHAG